jgi:hypothetical protein
MLIWQMTHNSIGAWLKRWRAARDEAQYIRAYRKMPEDAEEVEASYKISLQALALAFKDDPWEPEDNPT